MFKRGTCIEVICTHLVSLQRRSCSFSMSLSCSRSFFFFFFSFCTYSCHKRCLRKRKIVRELKMTQLNTKKMSVILRRSLNWVSIMVNIPVRLSSLMWVETFRHVTSAQQKRRERERARRGESSHLPHYRSSGCLSSRSEQCGWPVCFYANSSDEPSGSSSFDFLSLTFSSLNKREENDLFNNSNPLPICSSCFLCSSGKLATHEKDHSSV